MQLRLVGVDAGDVEHQAANLDQAAEIVIHAESVDEHVDGSAVLAAKRGLKITELALFFQGLGVTVTLVGGEIDLGGNIDLQKFITAGIAEHPHLLDVQLDSAAL